MDKSIPDSGNVFEHLHLAMEDFCLNANLRQRLSTARWRLLLLRVEDFPEHMRGHFRQLMEDLPKSNQAYFRDAERVPIAKALLSLYTKAACLDGVFQDALCADLAAAVEALHRTERELEERTASVWALRLEKERRELAAQLEQCIATLAYQLWQSRGCPIGSPEVDWFQAEQELKANREPASVSA